MCANMTETEEKREIKRRRTEIKLITENTKRQVTFTKRRQGLFRKAQNLAEKCEAEIAVMVVSAAGNFYGFGNPKFNTVVERYKEAKSKEERLDELAAAAAADEVQWVEVEPDPDENSGSGSGSGYLEESSDVSPRDSSLDLDLSLGPPCGETVALPGNEKSAASATASSTAAAELTSSWASRIENMNLEELQQLVESMEEQKKKIIELSNQMSR